MECIYRGFRKKWYSNETYIYEVYECIDDNETRYFFEKSSQVSKLPNDAIPVTVEIQKEEWHMPAFHETMYKPPKGPTYYNFRTYLKAQKNFITQYYEHIEFSPAHLIGDINGDVKDQTIRDKNGDEI